jgi:hypothetical protein
MLPWWGWVIIAVAAIFTVSAGVMLVILINIFRDARKRATQVWKGIDHPMRTHERTERRPMPRPADRPFRSGHRW